MIAAVDTPTCIRRSNQNALDAGPTTYCDPYGGYNTITIFPASPMSDSGKGRGHMLNNEKF
jgi:hypothetical protein